MSPNVRIYLLGAVAIVLLIFAAIAGRQVPAECKQHYDVSTGKITGCEDYGDIMLKKNEPEHPPDEQQKPPAISYGSSAVGAADAAIRSVLQIEGVPGVNPTAANFKQIANLARNIAMALGGDIAFRSKEIAIAFSGDFKAASDFAEKLAGPDPNTVLNAQIDIANQTAKMGNQQLALKQVFVGLQQQFYGGGPVLVPSDTPAQPPCKLDENTARKFLNAAALGAKDDADRTRIAAEAIQAACDLTYQWEHAKPQPLPAEIQRLIK